MFNYFQILTYVEKICVFLPMKIFGWIIFDSEDTYQITLGGEKKKKKQRTKENERPCSPFPRAGKCICGKSPHNIKHIII